MKRLFPLRGPMRCPYQSDCFLSRHLARTMATTLDSEKVTVGRPVPPTDYTKKYKEKLLSKAKAEGFSSIEKYLARFREEALKAERVAPTDPADAQIHSLLNNYLEETKLPPHVKPLRSILHLEKLADVTTSTLQNLWTQRYATARGEIGVTLPADVYTLFHARAKQYPKFVLPAWPDPTSPSAATYLLEHAGHQTFLAPLAAYKVHGAETPVAVTLTHYTDLSSAPHRLVLVHGTFDPEHVPRAVAQALLEETYAFYLEERALAHVARFHAAPRDFDFDAVVQAVRARRARRAGPESRETAE